jgi:hypothetical protein
MLPDDGDNKNGEAENVVPFPKTPEERRALRKAHQDQERQRLANTFVDEAGDSALFHSTDETAYADIIVSGHRETWSVRSKQFRYAYMRYLARQTDKLFETNPMVAALMKANMRKSAINAAIDDFEARAICSKIVREVHIRIAGHNDEIFIDLGNDNWEAVRITRAGWSIVDSPPVRFRRPKGMLALPCPERGGDVETLRQFLNTTTSDFVLAVAYLLASLSPHGPYPVLALYGEQGAAKTDFLKRLRSLVDPFKPATTGLPPSERDLFIAARNSHMQVYENVSKLTDAMSDAFCRLATGSGWRQRKLNTDSDEMLIDVMRPIAFEGISNAITRPDLQDRAIILPLERLSQRRTERELLKAFEPQRPKILGALLGMMVRGLDALPTTVLVDPPRLADFTQFATACGIQDFEAAYAANRDAAIHVILAHDPLAKAIRGILLGRRKRWTGIMEDLLDVVGPTSGIKSTKKLSDDLRRLAPMLRAVEIQITYGKRTGEERPLQIERVL